MKSRHHATCPWLRGWKRHRHHHAVFWKRAKIERVIARLFCHRWIHARDYHKGPVLGDGEYYLPTLEEAQTIIRNSHVDAKQYARFRFDCEDFAYVLKAHFCQAAYRHKRRQFAYCFGIIWGEELWNGTSAEPHAMNWMLTSDGVLRLVEPQTGTARELQPAAVADRRIYMMIA